MNKSAGEVATTLTIVGLVLASIFSIGGANYLSHIKTTTKSLAAVSCDVGFKRCGTECCSPNQQCKVGKCIDKSSSDSNNSSSASKQSAISNSGECTKDQDCAEKSGYTAKCKGTLTTGKYCQYTAIANNSSQLQQANQPATSTSPKPNVTNTATNLSALNGKSTCKGATYENKSSTKTGASGCEDFCAVSCVSCLLSGRTKYYCPWEDNPINSKENIPICSGWAAFEKNTCENRFGKDKCSMCRIVSGRTTLRKWQGINESAQTIGALQNDLQCKTNNEKYCTSGILYKCNIDTTTNISTYTPIETCKSKKCKSDNSACEPIPDIATVTTPKPSITKTAANTCSRNSGNCDSLKCCKGYSLKSITGNICSCVQDTTFSSTESSSTNCEYTSIKDCNDSGCNSCTSVDCGKISSVQTYRCQSESEYQKLTEPTKTPLEEATVIKDTDAIGVDEKTAAMAKCADSCTDISSQCTYNELTKTAKCVKLETETEVSCNALNSKCCTNPIGSYYCTSPFTCSANNATGVCQTDAATKNVLAKNVLAEQIKEQKLTACRRNASGTCICVYNASTQEAVCENTGITPVVSTTPTATSNAYSKTAECGKAGMACCTTRTKYVCEGDYECSTQSRDGICILSASTMTANATLNYIKSNTFNAATVSQIIADNVTKTADSLFTFQKKAQNSCTETDSDGKQIVCSGSCVYSDVNKEFLCQSKTELETAYAKQQNTIGGKNIGDSCNIFNSCGNSLLECNSYGKCQLTNEAKELLAYNNASDNGQVTAEASKTLLYDFTNDKTQALAADKDLSKNGCTATGRYFTQNGSCWYCLNSTTQAISEVPACQCSGNCAKSTGYGTKCQTENQGNCVRSNSICRVSSGPSDCPSNWICCKSAATDSGDLPKKGEQCNAANGTYSTRSECGNGLSCDKKTNTCQPEIELAYDYQANTVSDNLQKIPVVGGALSAVTSMLIDPVTRALDNNYYASFGVKAEVLETNVENCYTQAENNNSEITSCQELWDSADSLSKSYATLNKLNQQIKSGTTKANLATAVYTAGVHIGALLGAYSGETENNTFYNFAQTASQLNSSGTASSINYAAAAVSSGYVAQSAFFAGDVLTAGLGETVTASVGKWAKTQALKATKEAVAEGVEKNFLTKLTESIGKALDTDAMAKSLVENIPGLKAAETIAATAMAAPIIATDATIGLVRRAIPEMPIVGDLLSKFATNLVGKETAEETVNKLAKSVSVDLTDEELSNAAKVYKDLLTKAESRDTKLTVEEAAKAFKEEAGLIQTDAEALAKRLKIQDSSLLSGDLSLTAKQTLNREAGETTTEEVAITTDNTIQDNNFLKQVQQKINNFVNKVNTTNSLVEPVKTENGVSYTFGRNTTNQSFFDRTVSRDSHFELTVQNDGKLAIKDLKSGNGTLIWNSTTGKWISLSSKKSTVINNNSWLSIGDQVFKLVQTPGGAVYLFDPTNFNYHQILDSKGAWGSFVDNFLNNKQKIIASTLSSLRAEEYKPIDELAEEITTSIAKTNLQISKQESNLTTAQNEIKKLQTLGYSRKLKSINVDNLPTRYSLDRADANNIHQITQIAQLKENQVYNYVVTNKGNIYVGMRKIASDGSVDESGVKHIQVAYIALKNSNATGIVRSGELTVQNGVLRVNLSSGTFSDHGKGYWGKAWRESAESIEQLRKICSGLLGIDLNKIGYYGK